ncbi:MAG: SRPBCC domain-containing protein [Gammaproteobacteria bacterium]|nr:SRPBCC domain-containing protein [Gammaproteobacteria bacterium]
MQVIKWSIGVLVVVAVVVLAGFTGRKSVQAERVIAGSPEAIWAVLTDTASYGEWNPIFVRATGRYEEEGTMRYQMKTVDGGTTKVDARVRRVTDEREINQFGGMRGVLTFNHTWRLEPTAGGTRVTQHEEYRGIGVWFWNPAWVEEVYEEALVALEDRVRGLARRGAIDETISDKA